MPPWIADAEPAGNADRSSAGIAHIAIVVPFSPAWIRIWALLISFVVLMTTSSWLKGFRCGEIATDVPFLLTGLTLFLSNAGVLQVFGVNDHDSAELVSNLLGEGTVVFQTMSRALDAKATGMSYASQHVGRALLTPDEVRTLPGDRELLFLAGQRPIVVSKLRYYADREFAGLYDPA